MSEASAPEAEQEVQESRGSPAKQATDITSLQRAVNADFDPQGTDAFKRDKNTVKRPMSTSRNSPGGPARRPARKSRPSTSKTSSRRPRRGSNSQPAMPMPNGFSTFPGLPLMATPSFGAGIGGAGLGGLSLPYLQQPVTANAVNKPPVAMDASNPLSSNRLADTLAVINSVVGPGAGGDVAAKMQWDLQHERALRAEADLDNERRRAAEARELEMQRAALKKMESDRRRAERRRQREAEREADARRRAFLADSEENRRRESHRVFMLEAESRERELVAQREREELERNVRDFMLREKELHRKEMALIAGHQGGFTPSIMYPGSLNPEAGAWEQARADAASRDHARAEAFAASAGALNAAAGHLSNVLPGAAAGTVALAGVPVPPPVLPGVAGWSSAEVAAWIRSLPLSKDYGPLVQQHHIVGAVLLGMSPPDWRSIGLTTFGDLKIIEKFVQILAATVGGHDVSSAQSAAAPHAATGGAIEAGNQWSSHTLNNDPPLTEPNGAAAFAFRNNAQNSVVPAHSAAIERALGELDQLRRERDEAFNAAAKLVEQQTEREQHFLAETARLVELEGARSKAAHDLVLQERERAVAIEKLFEEQTKAARERDEARTQEYCRMLDALRAEMWNRTVQREQAVMETYQERANREADREKMIRNDLDAAFHRDAEAFRQLEALEQQRLSDEENVLQQQASTAAATLKEIERQDEITRELERAVAATRAALANSVVPPQPELSMTPMALGSDPDRSGYRSTYDAGKETLGEDLNSIQRDLDDVNSMMSRLPVN